jgi:hypothetical protein
MIDRTIVFMAAPAEKVKVRTRLLAGPALGSTNLRLLRNVKSGQRAGHNASVRIR